MWIRVIPQLSWFLINPHTTPRFPGHIYIGLHSKLYSFQKILCVVHLVLERERETERERGCVCMNRRSSTTSYKGMNAVNGASSRTVLITGVGRGLGRALALELAKRGHTVIGCARTQDRLNSLQSDFPDPSDKHLLLNADVVSPSLSLSLFCHVVKWVL